MDVIKLLIKWLVGLFLLTVIAVFAGREYLAVKTVNLVSNDYKKLFYNYTVNAKDTVCKEKFGKIDTGLGNHIYQLRFTSKTTYVTEVLCGGLPSQTVTLVETRLPPFTTHSPVGSGFIANEKDKIEAVGLSVFKESEVDWQNLVLAHLKFLTKNFYLVKHAGKLEKQTDFASIQPLITADAGPKTTCEGYGYNCCNLVTSLGTGKQMSQATDCKDSCYLSCKPRPVILGFNASNGYDPYTRTVTLDGANNSVSFAVVVDSNGLDVSAVKVDFGDGQSAKLSGQGPFEVSHTYVCNQTQCVYQAKVVVTTIDGVESYDSTISHLKVVVNR